MNTSQDGLWTMTKDRLEKNIRVLEATIAKHGGDPRQLFDRLRTDDAYADRIAEFMLRDGLESSTHIQLVRALMGNERVWGTEEWSSIYGVNFTEEQLREVAEFPWGEDILNAPCPFVKGKSVKDTHFAFLGLDRIQDKPLTILKLQELHPATGQPRFYFADNPWHDNQEFATQATPGLHWYLISLEIAPNSTRKTYQEQVAMLPADDYEAPLAVAEVLKYILYYRKNGKHLNPSSWGRCRNITSDGRRVSVGFFEGDERLAVGRWLDDRRASNFGVAASRKFPSTSLRTS